VKEFQGLHKSSNHVFAKLIWNFKNTIQHESEVEKFVGEKIEKEKNEKKKVRSWLM